MGSGRSGISLKVGTAGAGSQDLPLITMEPFFFEIVLVLILNSQLSGNMFEKVPANHCFLESGGKNREGTQASPA